MNIKRRTVTLGNGYQYTRLSSACRHCGAPISKREGPDEWMHGNQGRPTILCRDLENRAEPL